jgi:hypothetical protein
MSRRTIRRIRYHGTLTEENDFIVLGGGEPSSGDRRQNFICSLTFALISEVAKDHSNVFQLINYVNQFGIFYQAS